MLYNHFHRPNLSWPVGHANSKAQIWVTRWRKCEGTNESEIIVATRFCWPMCVCVCVCLYGGCLSNKSLQQIQCDFEWIAIWPMDLMAIYISKRVYTCDVSNWITFLPLPFAIVARYLWLVVASVIVHLYYFFTLNASCYSSGDSFRLCPLIKESPSAQEQQ